MRGREPSQAAKRMVSYAMVGAEYQRLLDARRDLSRYEDADGDDGENAVREQIATGERDERGRIGGEW